MKIKYYLFPPAVAVAALVLAGCASGPQIHRGLTTTTPVTQNRDHAIYDWPTRHAAVLDYNRTHQPEIVLIGDSICHYWGGEPVAPKAWALMFGSAPSPAGPWKTSGSDGIAPKMFSGGLIMAN